VGCERTCTPEKGDVKTREIGHHAAVRLLQRRDLLVLLWSLAAYLAMFYVVYRWGGVFSYGQRPRFK
jgi:hypothetical protein